MEGSIPPAGSDLAVQLPSLRRGKRKAHYPKNPYVKNSNITDMYLFCRRNRFRLGAKLLGLLLGCDIRCEIPSSLFIPHPTGIIVDTHCVLGNNVVLLQQVTLGVQYPYGRIANEIRDPVLKDGVYVGPGAKILGQITVGEWSVIGANAVITCDVPANSIAVGHNKILKMSTLELERKIMSGEV
jgi:serine acetyltransferase